jgi:hypothetical protein
MFTEDLQSFCAAGRYTGIDPVPISASDYQILDIKGPVTWMSLVLSPSVLSADSQPFVDPHLARIPHPSNSCDNPMFVASFVAFSIGPTTAQAVSKKSQVIQMRPKKQPKSFFEMTSFERDAVAAKLAKGTDYRDTQPLSGKDRAMWEAARRGRGTKIARCQSSSRARDVRSGIAFPSGCLYEGQRHDARRAFGPRSRAGDVEIRRG